MAAGIVWRDGGRDGALAEVLARSAGDGRPVLLYWGAAWCPPCNRLKSEVFGHEAVIAQLAKVSAVQLDGDSAGAQALAEQYRLRSYPTLVLFAPDGGEISRLPCELDGELFAATLALALRVGAAGGNAARSLQAALAGDTLNSEQWTLLSHYSWDTDEASLLGQRGLAPTLRALHAAAPAGAARLRLGLHAQLAERAADPVELLALCADPAQARANMDILCNSGASLLKWLVAADQRAAVATALHAQAVSWAEDLWLGRPDRLAALRLQGRLERLGAPAAKRSVGIEQQMQVLLDEAGPADHPHERHTLLNTAVSALNDAGLAPQAEALLRAELDASHAPFYFMLSLASAARRRGDHGAVLDWYERAWQGARGPATRLQWGATLLASLVELAPQDRARIERAAEGMLEDIGAAPDAFRQRNRAQLRKLEQLPAGWNGAGPHSDRLLQRIVVGLAA
ncbi:thioredoxin family protein [Rugamonas sp. CCM 8940]|uniref:thioredoxin family protein n=1 Tax=Rugamonas sp. CCM 8940 TaxID=2765359 RepID=UPI0018F4F4BA|nr:thioredoxin family protein [Rugamonas sp. CCM 8940]MBJ7309749.1 thioredoxin family protein [Rugamonas sp. CCM 8940]